MAPWLDPLGFPHIIEAIFHDVPWKQQLDARLVSSSMRNVMDSLLAHSELWLIVDKKGKLRATTRNVALLLLKGLPYFHPEGDSEAQHAAIQRAQNLIILAAHVTPRLNSLLQHIQPTCEVLFDHKGMLQSDLHIPRCASLLLNVNPGCVCFASSTGRFTHEASSVDLHLGGDISPSIALSLVKGRRGGGKCSIMAGTLNADVTRFMVTGNVCALPALFDDLDVSMTHDLNVLVRCWRTFHGTTMEALRRDISICFNIPESRIKYFR